MINDLNRFTCMGHIGADPKPATSDNAPLRLSVATSSHWMVGETRNSRTEWHTIVVFGNLRKYAAKLKKGDRVYVEAQARSNNYERQIGGEAVKFYETQFVATDIERLAEKSETEKVEEATSIVEENQEAETPEPEKRKSRKK